MSHTIRNFVAHKETLFIITCDIPHLDIVIQFKDITFALVFPLKL